MITPLLTPEDVAAEIGVSLRTLSRWRTDGTGPPWIKAGHHARYRPADVEAWLTRRQEPAPRRSHPGSAPRRRPSDAHTPW